jgi:hypothetical protein
MKIKKRDRHQVGVEPGDTRNGSFAKPGSLLTSKIKTVRHAGNHPTVRHESICGSHLNEAPARSDGNCKGIERERRDPVSLCQQAGGTDQGKDKQAKQNSQRAALAALAFTWQRRPKR